MFIEPFFRSLPLAAPTVVGSVVVAVLGASWWARWLRVPRSTAVGYVSVIGAYLGVTATPTAVGLWANPGSSGGISLDVHLPPVGDFMRISSDSLNLLAGAMVGVAAVAMWCAGRRWIAIATAAGLPVAVEIVQQLVPAMGRVGFSMTDVVVNWAGAGVGIAIGSVVAMASRAVVSARTVS